MFGGQVQQRKWQEPLPEGTTKQKLRRGKCAGCFKVNKVERFSKQSQRNPHLLPACLLPPGPPPPTRPLLPRSPDRVRDTVNSIRRASGSSSVHGYTADLSDLAAVRQLAAAVTADHSRLTALVNNAGVYETQKR